MSNPCSIDSTCVVNDLANSYQCKPAVYINQQPVEHFTLKKSISSINQTEFEDSYFEEQHSAESNFCKINVCENGATCLSDTNKKGMKCSCMPGFTGIFCENIIPQFTKPLLIPKICENETNSTNISKNSVSVTASFKENSFYILQGYKSKFKILIIC